MSEPFSWSSSSSTCCAANQPGTASASVITTHRAARRSTWPGSGSRKRKRASARPEDDGTHSTEIPAAIEAMNTRTARDDRGSGPFQIAAATAALEKKPSPGTTHSSA
jgi:hypothetical protein